MPYTSHILHIPCGNMDPCGRAEKVYQHWITEEGHAQRHVYFLHRLLSPLPQIYLT